MEKHAIKAFIKQSLLDLHENKKIHSGNVVVIPEGNYGLSHGASFIEISTVENLFKRYCPDKQIRFSKNSG